VQIKKEIPHIIGVVLTGGLWIPFWLIFIWNRSIKRKLDKKTKIETIQRRINNLDQFKNETQDLLNEISESIKNGSIGRNVLKIYSVSLFESRQLTSTTRSTGNLDATTKTGTLGIGVKIGAVGIGGARSKGKTEGVIKTTGLTTAGRDEITKIDSGVFLISHDSVSFSGSQFSRSNKYEEIIHLSYSEPRIIFSPKNSEKNWIVGINNTVIYSSAKEMLEKLINNHASTTEKEILDQLSTVKSNLNREIIKTEDQIRELEREIEDLSLEK
jgi:hypothetical protein